MEVKKRIYTIGHSTRTIEEFLELLKINHITHLIDVRTLPYSRRHPWFNKEILKEKLQAQNIQYLSMPNLGGLRKPAPNSINAEWKNTHFRGYADYMQTELFDAAIQELNQLIQKQNIICIMCSEAVPWKCHRSLIGDAEIARGIEVFDIINLKTIRKHSLTSFAVIEKSRNKIKVFYPASQKSFKI